jgi:anthranilate/para-aminobenzoate synthase component I
LPADCLLIASLIRWAIQFLEEMEESPRCWYGGAVGMLGFDGHLNTGLTLRTVRIANGVAEVREAAPCAVTCGEMAP